MNAAIFDLDQTLVDSGSLEPLRRRRRWAEVYRNVGQCRVFDGIKELLTELRAGGVKIAVVTSGPRTYAQKVLAHGELEVDVLVAYHDTREHKPASAPINAALSRLDANPEQSVSVGDDAIDILASRRASPPWRPCGLQRIRQA